MIKCDWRAISHPHMPFSPITSHKHFEIATVFKIVKKSNNKRGVSNKSCLLLRSKVLLGKEDVFDPGSPKRLGPWF